ncbi:MAG TPA: hypothetical protein VF665_16030 [Longimicrobium sp.]|uniref:hypothetical protein n=1 Tax=Longimicrobium sp. TaxID=2029185 RepID=UPI002ED899C8
MSFTVNVSSAPGLSIQYVGGLFAGIIRDAARDRGPASPSQTPEQIPIRKREKGR